MGKRSKCMAVMAAMFIMAASLVPFASPSWDAAGDPGVTVSTVGAEPGDTVDVNVNFNDASLASFRVTLEYDNDLMILESPRNRLSDGEMAYSKVTLGKVNITWFCDSNILLDGTVAATASFTVNQRTEAGTYPIYASIDNTFDMDENPVKVTVSSGAIVVSTSSDVASVSVIGGPVKPLGTTDVRIWMANANLVAFKLDLSFDTDYLTFKNARSSSSVESAGILTVNDNGGRITITWISNDPSANTSFGGDIITLTFEVNYGISGVRVPIDLSVDGANTFDSSLRLVVLRTVGGEVRIVDGDTHLDVPGKNVIKEGISERVMSCSSWILRRTPPWNWRRRS